MTKQITLTQEQADYLIEFIYDTLKFAWEKHIEFRFDLIDSLEDGTRKMNPLMYDLMDNLEAGEISAYLAIDIQNFIDDTLYDKWKEYNRRYVCKETIHEGLFKMNPKMYDLMVDIQQQLDNNECNTISQFSEACFATVTNQRSKWHL